MDEVLSPEDFKALLKGIDENEKVMEAYTRLHASYMKFKDREELPSRRTGYIQKVRIRDTNVFLRTGEYADGRLGEIFVDVAKDGEQARAWLNCFAIAISLGLQYGVPLQKFVDAFVFRRFEPSGPLRGHDRLRHTTSIVDFVFRDLAISYLKDESFAHVPPSPEPPTEP